MKNAKATQKRLNLFTVIEIKLIDPEKLQGFLNGLMDDLKNDFKDL